MNEHTHVFGPYDPRLDVMWCLTCGTPSDHSGNPAGLPGSGSPAPQPDQRRPIVIVAQQPLTQPEIAEVRDRAAATGWPVIVLDHRWQVAQ